MKWGNLKRWLIPGAGQERYKTSLKYLVPENEEVHKKPNGVCLQDPEVTWKGYSLDKSGTIKSIRINKESN